MGEATSVAKDIIVIGNDSGMLRACDVHDGSQLWEHNAGHPFGGPALAQAGETIIAASLDGYCCALHGPDGAIRWQQRLPGVTEPVFENGIHVVASNDCVAMQYGSHILALNPIDGGTLWEYTPSPKARTAWLVGSGPAHVYIVEQQFVRAPTSAGSSAEDPLTSQRRAPVPTQIVSALSAMDGSIHWMSAEYGAVEPVWDSGSSLVEADDVVYAYGRGLHALDAGSGQLRWTQGDIPTFHVGDIAVGRAEVTVALGGYLGAYRRDTGDRLWSESGRSSESQYFEMFTSTHMFDNEGLVVDARMGFNPKGVQIEARESDSGTLRWTWPSNDMDPQISWRICQAGSALCVPVNGALLGLRSSTGQELWRTALGGSSYSLLGASVGTHTTP